MTTINKLKNGWFSNDTSSLDGTYNKVSILNEGKTELKGDTLINSKLAINKNIDSSNDYKLDVLGNSNMSGSMFINPTGSNITISNYNFSTPAQASINSFSTIASPYSSIGGWTISLVSGTALSVFIGRGFTALVNTYDYLFSDYPLYTQYLSFQGTATCQMNVSQSLSFPSTGNYLLTMYGWGEYNRYSTNNTISITCGNGSVSNFSMVEQAWTKIVMKFQITTAGSNTLTITVTNLGTNSGLSISGIQIIKQSGLILSDGGNVNNQLITQSGLYMSGFILNQGNIINYGSIKNYGALSLTLPYSSGSLVLGSCSYGSSNSSDSGKYNIIIGQSNLVSSPSVALNVLGCVAIGYASLEQGGSAVGGLSRCIGIGYQANRWNNLNCNDNCGIGYQTGQALGYSGSSSQRNVALGNYVLSGAYVASNDNTIVGHNSMSGANFSTGRSFNSCLGSSSMTNIVSTYNSSLGYGSGNNIVNTSSNYNTFIGASVCTTQSGALNVLSNCTFLGATSNVSVTGNYSNSTCIGYGSLIDGNNKIILGRSTEVTYAMGGLNIPASTVLTLLGNISANSLTITPAQLSFLNQVASNQIPTSAITNYGSGYQLISGMSSYQTVAGMSSYLTTLNASTTYQTIANMSNYLTTSNASTTYQTIANMSNYVDLVNSQSIDGVKTFTSAPVMSGEQILADSIPVISINTFDLTEFVNALIPPPVDLTGSFVDLTSDQTIGGAKTFSFPPTLTGSYITGIPLTAIPNLGANFTRKNVDQTITGIYTFSYNPVFNTNAILDSYLSTNVNNSITNANNFINQYNLYINFQSNLSGDIMNLTNCNPKLTAGNYLDITGASIKTTSATISETKVSFLNQVDASNKIPTSAIDGYGSGYLTISSASSTYQLQANMSSYLTTSTASSTYQTITEMSNYASINGLSKLGGSINVMGGSYSLNFGDNRFLIMDNYPIITSIGLPSPTSSNNLGCIFSIVNKAGIPPNRSVSAPAGQTIYEFSTGTNASSIVIKDIGVIEFVCVGVSPTNTTTWAVLNRDDNVLKSGNQTIAGIKTFSSPPVMSGASITAGTIPYTAINSSYIPDSVATLASTDVALSSPLNNYYIFTSGASATTITLPLITTQIIGCPLTFRRVGNATSALNIKTPASSATTIVQRASIAETAQNTNYTFLSTTQFIGTVMAISLTKWSVVS